MGQKLPYKKYYIFLEADVFTRKSFEIFSSKLCKEYFMIHDFKFRAWLQLHWLLFNLYKRIVWCVGI